jgi:hypothetical protein
MQDKGWVVCVVLCCCVGVCCAVLLCGCVLSCWDLVRLRDLFELELVCYEPGWVDLPFHDQLQQLLPVPTQQAQAARRQQGGQQRMNELDGWMRWLALDGDGDDWTFDRRVDRRSE